jgi:hypothetical protein
VDTEQQTEAIRQDLDALEGAAERSAQRLARRVAPYVLATAVLAVLAWRMGRKARNRSDGRG